MRRALWGTFRELWPVSREIHAAPVDDELEGLTQHELEGICPCNPEILVCPAGVIVSHNELEGDRYYDDQEIGRPEDDGEEDGPEEDLPYALRDDPEDWGPQGLDFH